MYLQCISCINCVHFFFFFFTARTLHRILEWRNHGVPWPSVRLPITELLNHITKRINEASGTYQMFGVLGDIALLTE